MWGLIFWRLHKLAIQRTSALIIRFMHLKLYVCSLYAHSGRLEAHSTQGSPRPPVQIAVFNHTAAVGTTDSVILVVLF